MNIMNIYNAGTSSCCGYFQGSIFSHGDIVLWATAVTAGVAARLMQQFVLPKSMGHLTVCKGPGKKGRE